MGNCIITLKIYWPLIYFLLIQLLTSHTVLIRLLVFIPISDFHTISILHHITCLNSIPILMSGTLTPASFEDHKEQAKYAQSANKAQQNNVNYHKCNHCN